MHLLKSAQMTGPFLFIDNHGVSLLPLELVAIHVAQLWLLECHVDFVARWGHIAQLRSQIAVFIRGRLVNQSNFGLRVNPRIVFVVHFDWWVQLREVVYFFEVACPRFIRGINARDALFLIELFPLNVVGCWSWKIIFLWNLLELIGYSVSRGFLIHYIFVDLESFAHVVGCRGWNIFFDTE